MGETGGGYNGGAGGLAGEDNGVEEDNGGPPVLEIESFADEGGGGRLGFDDDDDRRRELPDFSRFSNGSGVEYIGSSFFDLLNDFLSSSDISSSSDFWSSSDSFSRLTFSSFNRTDSEISSFDISVIELLLYFSKSSSESDMFRFSMMSPSVILLLSLHTDQPLKDI